MTVENASVNTPSTATEAAPALRIEDLSVTFLTDAGVVDAVRDVSYRVRRGEILAVVGESGSGKSVSSRTAIGLLPDTATVTGHVYLGDHEVTAMSNKQMHRLRGKDVAMVFQEPGAALDPLFTVGYQIAEAVRAHPMPGHKIGRKQARDRAVELLTMVGLPDPQRRVDYYPHELSGGQKQRVVIAIAIACDPAVIIADEPTTALDVTVQAEILALLRDLRDRLDSAIVLITHNMGVVAEMADRVVVMNRGRVVEEAGVTDLFAHPRAAYTRQLLDAVPHLGAQDSPAPVAEDAETVLAVRDLSVVFPGGVGSGSFTAVEEVSFTIARGETFGLVGESGSGKTTIGRCVAGLQSPSSGSITVLGTDIAGLSPRRLKPLRKRFGFVFQDPATSLNPRMTVGECIAEPLIVHDRVSGATARRARVRELLDAVRLPAGTEKRYPHELSGGQRQRANLARALILEPDLVVADEPTSALDVSVQASVLELFAELQQRWNFGALFISHDLAVVEILAHRVGVLQHGRLVESGPTESVLRSPAQPYTQRLLAAVPVPDPARARTEGRTTSSTSVPDAGEERQVG
ncbi:ABC transporter ATP-binding protein [Gordonia jinhuaensis]|uniref:Oligopeptide ABC transporter, ATP-binding protein n=1 Tax=Gordonia jinhuaensis TaxID=1517702 RepID=A0A916T5F9_9ACTN|nr:ABC transporter ATP-binding protein [Gordonia jinhuaensis]GGB32392.1 putative oligopeptide ABC transporter, ATP-binding protein [Gordonia jinhuaensis]